jgi:predicted SAM-dependent methyltransferase
MMSLAKRIAARLRPSPAPRLAPAAADISRAKEQLAAQSRLHLGCGSNVMPGWANLDLEGAAPVIQWDLTQPIPAASNSFDYIYSEHFIEHIGFEEARRLVRECQRLLRPGGTLRLSTPSLEKLVDEYRSGRLTEWDDMRWRPQTSCQLMNEGMRLWGHQFVYDLPELLALLRGSGFSHVERVEWRKSSHEALLGIETRPYHDELIVEARK